MEFPLTAWLIIATSKMLSSLTFPIETFSLIHNSKTIRYKMWPVCVYSNGVHILQF